MVENIVLKLNEEQFSDTGESSVRNLFQEYERVIVESLITSFGLDFLVRDQHGGDVDTIHNVRAMDTDEKMVYKNKENQNAYENRGEYDSQKYHKHEDYTERNREIKRQQEDGSLIDKYTGKTFKRNAKKDLDHVISAKEIHDDRGRVLAEVDGADLANITDNLYATHPSINRSKKADSPEEFLERKNKVLAEKKDRIKELKSSKNLTEKEIKELNKYKALEDIDDKEVLKAAEKARKRQNAILNKKYYTSSKFAKDTAKAAGKIGLSMGIRQALGFIFAEIWFEVKAEFQKIKGNFNIENFFKAIIQGIKQGFANAKEKYKEILAKFKDGAIAGALSSLTTTLCNIFATTAKNIVRIIRQSWVSIVEAAKILFINPDNLSYGDKMKAVTKIIATAASVILGTVVSEFISKSPLGQIPVVGEIVSIFCGTFVTGILSCTLLYYLDRSDSMKKLVNFLNKLDGIGSAVEEIKKQVKQLEAYAAQLMKIDIEKFEEETALYSSIVKKIEIITDVNELSIYLINIHKKLGFDIPWGEGSFDTFMQDKSKTLVFK